MTIKELEKYCVEQSIKSAKRSHEYRHSNMHITASYHAGQANAFMWIAAVIQQNKPRETPH